jgi:hypothetical protein
MPEVEFVPLHVLVRWAIRRITAKASDIHVDVDRVLKNLFPAVLDWPVR